MEQWEKIKGYENMYEVSSDGRVRSIDRITNSSLKNNKSVIKKGRVLKPRLKKDGYLSITLCKGNIKKTCNIHRLVANTYIELIDNKPIINHINGIKTDNRYSNLEWCTSKENSIHASRIGLMENANKKKILCVELNKEFESSYKAAEWLNANIYSYSKDIKGMSRNIRTVCQGKRKKAFNYSWKDLV